MRTRVFSPLILDSEDSVIMDIVEGLHQASPKLLGLIYPDAHGDFNTPETTPSGLIGGMDMAMLAGHGPDLLTNIFGNRSHFLAPETLTCPRGRCSKNPKFISTR